MKKGKEKKVCFINDISMSNNTDASLLNNTKNQSLNKSDVLSYLNNLNKDSLCDEIKLKTDVEIKENKEESNDYFQQANKNKLTETENTSVLKRVNYLLFSPMKDSMKDEVDMLLEEKEHIKTKEFTRREMSKKKRSSTGNKKDIYFNAAIVTNLIDEESKTSEYGVYFKYLKFLDILVSITVCVNIVISLIDNSIYIDQSNKYIKKYLEDNNVTNINITILASVGDREISDTENSFRWINIFVIISNEVFIILSYYVHLKIMQSTYKISKYDNILSSGLYKKMLLELIFMGIFNPPNFNQVITGSMIGILYVYEYNSLFTYLAILKSYVILRVYSYFSKWTSNMAKSICQKYKVDVGIQFAIKAELKKRPYTMLTLMMVISLGILGFGTRTFEYGVKDENMQYQKGKKIENDLVSLNNCFWLIIVTMTTVGYGDIAPKTHYGRFLSVIACIIGMLLVSLIVVSLTIISQFSPEEKKAYSFIKKLHASDTAYCKAANVILKLLYVRRSFMSKTSRIKNSIAERFIFVLQLKKDLAVFKNDYKLANNYALPIDEMLKNLESKLKEDMNLLLKNIAKLENQNDALDCIYKEQTILQDKLKNIIKMQDVIAQYVVRLNNEAYQNELFNN